jgi:hypothetical protein
MPGAPPSDKDSTTSQAMDSQITHLINHMRPNCEPDAQDPVVIRTCFSWTLSAQQSLITAISRTYWLQRVF